MVSPVGGWSEVERIDDCEEIESFRPRGAAGALRRGVLESRIDSPNATSDGDGEMDLDMDGFTLRLLDVLGERDALAMLEISKSIPESALERVPAFAL